MLAKLYKRVLSLIFVVFSVIFISGCGCKNSGVFVFGTTRVSINHEPLEPIEVRKSGKILVKTFLDRRTNTKYIGNKRNTFFIALGHLATEKSVPLEYFLTKYFAETLREVGYIVVVQNAEHEISPYEIDFDAILEGEILEFWFDGFAVISHKVAILMKVLDKDRQQILWKKEIRSKETNAPIFAPAPALEFEIVIKEALTKTLNQAKLEFASDGFYNSIKKDIILE